MFCRFGIAAAQPARRRHRLIERRVHAARGRIHQRGQRIDVRALQLLDAAPLEHERRQFVAMRQFLEHVLRGRNHARLAGLLRRLQIQLREQHVAQLFRRVDVELAAGVPKDRGAELVEVGLHPAGRAGQRVRVDLARPRARWPPAPESSGCSSSR